MSQPVLGSLNVGGVRVLHWRGRAYETGFVKDPTPHRLFVSSEGVAGDRQADRTVHGGRDKAVYAYPDEHYRSWREVLARDVGAGAFGENLTTVGIAEPEIRIGDRLRIGDTVLRVTQPRLPCVKMAARFQRADLPKLFLQARRPGFYLRVEREGHVGAGDPIELEAASTDAPTLLEVFDILSTGRGDPDALARVLASPSLGAGARKHLIHLQQVSRVGA